MFVFPIRLSDVTEAALSLAIAWGILMLLSFVGEYLETPTKLEKANAQIVSGQMVVVVAKNELGMELIPKFSSTGYCTEEVIKEENSNITWFYFGKCKK